MRLEVKKIVPQKRLSTKVFAATLASFFMSSLAVSLGSVIDGFVIGHTMDATAAGACGLVNPLTFLFALIGSVLGSGYPLPCADYLARGEVEKARKLFSTVIIA